MNTKNKKIDPTCDYNEENYYNSNFQKNNTVYDNLNHQKGQIMSILFLILFISLLCIPFKTKNYKEFSIISIIILMLILKIILKEPIILLYFFSFLIARKTFTEPFLDKNKYFVNYQKFEGTNYKIIKKEVYNVINNKDILKKVSQITGKTYNNAKIGIDDGWKIIPIKIGSVYKDNIRKYFPKVCNILDECPEILSCLVSVLGPGKRIPIHVGYYKGFIRYQLAIEIPNESDTKPFICVNGIKKYWTEGQGFLFDDTFPHKVYNPTKKKRIVFYMDILRTLENSFLNKINKMVIYKFMNLSIVKNNIRKEVNNTEKQI